LVVTTLAVERRTIEEYVRLLEDLFLIERLPAWGKTLRARSGTAPTGSRSYTMEDRLHVLPVDRLWTPVGS
jgi:hypothetical protein